MTEPTPTTLPLQPPAVAVGEAGSAPHMPAAPAEPLWWRLFALGFALVTLAAAALSAFTQRWESR